MPLSIEQFPITDLESKEAKNAISIARLRLIMDYPFFGQLCVRLIPKEETRLPTLATDGKFLYYNPRYVLGITDPVLRSLSQKEYKEMYPSATTEQVEAYGKPLSKGNMLFVICHEILHIAFNHLGRKNNRNHELWNMAADYAENQVLVKSGVGEINPSWLYSNEFDGMVAEEIYEILLAEAKEAFAQQMLGGGGGGGGQGQPGDGSGQSQDGGGTGVQKRSYSFTKPSRGTTLDDHGFNPDNSSDEELERRVREFRQAVPAAAQAAGMDKVPEGLRSLISEFIEPKIDWRTKLIRTFQSFIKNDCSYVRPNRRSYNMGVILPGLMPQDEVDIAVAIDLSGSISDDMVRDFLSEVYGFTDQFTQFKVKLMCFDTSVNNVEDYDENNIDELRNFDLKGGGGTDFDSVYRYMKSNDYKPKQLVMFTDGYPCGSWGDDNYCPSLFVIHGSKTIVAPFGDTAYYEDEK